MAAVHIFWDNSNIFIPARSIAGQRDGPMQEHAVRVQFDNMYRLASAGRDVNTAVCVGSVPPELEAVWDRLEDAGVEIELYERGVGSGKEQGVDQCLQVHMLRALADAKEPAVAVLMTGDGAGYLDGAGFHADLERMAKKGWGIEVISWDIACNKRLKTWAQKEGVYIPLENYYQSVTFIEQGRHSKPVSLTNRPTAKPRG